MCRYEAPDDRSDAPVTFLLFGGPAIYRGVVSLPEPWALVWLAGLIRSIAASDPERVVSVSITMVRFGLFGLYIAYGTIVALDTRSFSVWLPLSTTFTTLGCSRLPSVSDLWFPCSFRPFEIRLYIQTATVPTSTDTHTDPRTDVSITAHIGNTHVCFPVFWSSSTYMSHPLLTLCSRRLSFSDELQAKSSHTSLRSWNTLALLLQACSLHVPNDDRRKLCWALHSEWKFSSEEIARWKLETHSENIVLIVPGDTCTCMLHIDPHLTVQCVLNPSLFWKCDDFQFDC